MDIILDFGNFQLDAELFPSGLSEKLYEKLPLTLEITAWGNEIYGPLPLDLGSVKAVPSIPPGGLAYSQRGRYFCVFFGQNPAWPVDHIGRIKAGGWEELVKNPLSEQMTLLKV